MAACGGDKEGDRGASPRAEATGPGSAQATDSARLSPAADTPVVLFFGNSLTAGLGVLPEHAFPALIQQKIDSAGFPFRVRNAGVSGETSADGVRRIGWVLHGPVRVLVLELGANDALRGLPVARMEANLQAIIDSTQSHYPDAAIVIAGMLAPPNLGASYGTRFRDAFHELARRNDAALIPFLLQDVAAHPGLNQADGLHPTAEGHRIVAENVWKVLEPVLRQQAREATARSRPGSR